MGQYNDFCCAFSHSSLPLGLPYRDILQFECARVLTESQTTASSLKSWVLTQNEDKCFGDSDIPMTKKTPIKMMILRLFKSTSNNSCWSMMDLYLQHCTPLFYLPFYTKKETRASLKLITEQAKMAGDL